MLDLGYTGAITTLISFYQVVSPFMKTMIEDDVKRWCDRYGWSYDIKKDGTINLLTPEEIAPQNA